MLSSIRYTPYFVKMLSILLVPLFLLSSCSAFADPFADIREPLPLYQFELGGETGVDYGIKPKEAVRLVNAHVRQVYQKLYPKENPKSCPLIKKVEYDNSDEVYCSYYGIINNQLLLDFTGDYYGKSCCFITLMGESGMSRRNLKIWNAYACTLLFIIEGYDHVAKSTEKNFRSLINDFTQYFPADDFYKTKLGSIYLSCFTLEDYRMDSEDTIYHHLVLKPVRDDIRNDYY